MELIVKKHFGKLLSCLMLTTSFLSAEVGSNFDYELTLQSLEQPDDDKKRPFKVEASYDYVGRSKINKHNFRGQNIKFAEGFAEISAVYYYNPKFEEGLTAHFSYTNTLMDWDDNPYFDKSHFHNYNFKLGFFTKRACNWLILGFVQLNLDADHPDIGEYATYDGLLWARYDFCQNWNIHLGLVALTGMKIDQVFPVIGFDWKPNQKWTINAVFPVDMSIEYHLTPNWTVELEARVFNSRYRVGKHENLRKGLFLYRNTGAELGIDYHYASWLKVNAHVGYAFGGELKVANRHYEHKRHIDFDGAPYAGAEVGVRF